MSINRPYSLSRRGFLKASSVLGLSLVGRAVLIADAQSGAVSDPGPVSAFAFDRSNTAIVFTDPQNEVLSETGLAWGLVGGSVKENKTIENMERLFQAAKQKGFEVFISPHYYYPTDAGWKFNGPLETDEITFGMFARK